MGTKLVIPSAGGLPPRTDADRQFRTIIVPRARCVIYLNNIYIYMYMYTYIHMYIYRCILSLLTCVEYVFKDERKTGKTDKGHILSPKAL